MHPVCWRMFCVLACPGSGCTLTEFVSACTVRRTAMQLGKLYKDTGFEVGMFAVGLVKCSAESGKPHHIHHHGMHVSSLEAPPGHRVVIYSASTGGAMRDAAEQECITPGFTANSGVPENIRALRAAKTNFLYMAHMVGLGVNGMSLGQPHEQLVARSKCNR